MAKSGWKKDPRIAVQKLSEYTKPAIDVEVGVLANAQDYPDNNGWSVAEVASHHELDPSSPYKEWLKKSIEVNEVAQTLAFSHGMRASGNNDSKRIIEMLEFGDMVAKNVQSAVLQRRVGIGPNADSTKASKSAGGFGTVPMVETKHLISVIDSRISNG